MRGLLWAVVMILVLCMCSCGIVTDRKDNPVLNYDTPSNMSKAMDRVEEEVPELAFYVDYISEKSKGRAHFTMRCDGIAEEVTSVEGNGHLDGKYFSVYVGEQWDDHSVNWDWFYVSENFETVLWYDLPDSEVYTLAEWRESSHYRLFGEDGRRIYNKNDADKNLFLQFINNDIGIINYGEEGKTVYYHEIWDLDKSDMDIYYILDMDGDGKAEFCYETLSDIEIIKYNKEKECFELWFSDTNKYRPVGNKVMYYALYTTANIRSYVVLDEFGNIVEDKAFSFSEGLDKETNEVKRKYMIDFVEVSESEWVAESEFLFEIIKTAPEARDYAWLLE